MLDPAHVRVHVTLSRARRRRRSCDRASAWADKHDAWRVTQSFAEAHAFARAAAIRRHHRNNGDDLGLGSLIREAGPSAYFIGAARMYSTFSFFGFFFFLAAE